MILQRHSKLVLALILIGASVGACRKEESTKPAVTMSDAELKAKLAAADKLDGEEDKVVVRCAGCMLGMDGHPDHTVTVSGYTLQLCSAVCKERFQEGMDAKLAALKVPAK